jgi:hypothetical protein
MRGTLATNSLNGQNRLSEKDNPMPADIVEIQDPEPAFDAAAVQDADDAEVHYMQVVTAQQLAAPIWPWAKVVEKIIPLQDFLVEEFKIHDPDFWVPDLVYGVDKLQAKVMGYYRGHYNGFGLRREIMFNSEYVGKNVDADNFWDVVAGTLAHELIHAYQDETNTARTKRNHHNEQFRELASAIGLVVTPKGEQSYDVKTGRFFELLKKHDPKIKVPDTKHLTAPIQQKTKKKGKSTLKKWGCGCQNFRSGKGKLFFRCTVPGCGQEVRLLEEDPRTQKKDASA